jgi:hypothetical protein
MTTSPTDIVQAVSDTPDSGKPSGSSNLMLLSGQKLFDGAKHIYSVPFPYHADLDGNTADHSNTGLNQLWHDR